jgi:hypothetical protein
MLSDGLRRAYRERGIGLIAPAAGTRAFVEEIGGAHREPEVVLAVDPAALVAREGLAGRR